MRNIFIVAVIVSFSVLQAAAQEEKSNNWSIGAGAGWFHYINTLDVGKDLVKTNHAGFTFRFMWEPEHRVAMGLESGYYTIYSLDRESTPQGPGGTAKLTAVPLLISFRIRVLPDLYVSGGPGLTIMYSNVDVLDNKATGSFLSLANLHAAVMYRKKINDRFDVGTELKFLNFGKTEDYGFTLQLVGAYRFRLRK